MNLFSDGRNLSSVASLETLDLTVGKRTTLLASHLTVGEGTTLLALSAIFSSSTIKDLNLDIDCPVTVSEGLAVVVDLYLIRCHLLK